MQMQEVRPLDMNCSHTLLVRCITRAMNDPDETLNSVSKIDRISR